MTERTAEAGAALRRRLGPDLTVLDELDELESAELLALIDEARVSQKAALDRSLDEVLGMLPRLVRGTARKIMFGSR